MRGSCEGLSYLNEVLALCFRNQGLEFRGGEGVDKASLGDDEEQHLGASEHR